MPNIRIKEGESFDSAIRRFKRAVEKAGIPKELRRRSRLFGRSRRNPVLVDQRMCDRNRTQESSSAPCLGQRCLLATRRGNRSPHQDGHERQQPQR